MAKKQKSAAAPEAPAGKPAPGPAAPGAIFETKRGRWVWLALFLFLFPLYLTCASNEFGGGLGGDNVVYYLLGKAIATGQGYVDLYLPGNPPHAKYPPGLPLLLAPFHLFSDRPLLPMHVMLIAFNTLAVVAAGMVVAKISGSRRAGLAVALLFGLGSRMYLQNLHILSEPPYMFFCYLSLLLLPGGKAETLTPARLAVIGLAATAAFFTRSMGIAVVAAVGAGLWFERATVAVKGRRLPAAIPALGIFTVFLLGWIVRNRLTGAGSAYLEELLYIDPYRIDLGFIRPDDFFTRLGKNLKHYYGEAAVYFVYDYLGGAGVRRAWLAAGYVFPWLMLAGLGLSVRRGERAVVVFVAASLFIVLAWSFQDPRFLAPVWPFLLYYLLVALTALARLVRLRRPWIVPAAVATALILFELTLLPGLVRLRFLDLTQPSHPVQVDGYGQAFTEPLVNYAKYEAALSIAMRPDVVPQRINFLIVNRVAATLTPSDSILLSRKPMYTYLLSGRKCVPLLASENPQKQWDYLTDNRVDYIVTGAGEDAMGPTFKQWPQRFSPVAGIGRYAYLIKVKRDR